MTIRRFSLPGLKPPCGRACCAIFHVHASYASAHRLRNWLQQDHRVKRREPETLEPDALDVDVRSGTGAKLERRLHGFLPAVHLLGTKSLSDGASPIQARGTGAEGWLATNVARDLAASPTAVAWADRYRTRFGVLPSGYSMTVSTAAMVIAAAAHGVARRRRPVTRASVRDATAAPRLRDAAAGPISFDPDGDPDGVKHPAGSVYQGRAGAVRHVETIRSTGAKGAPVKASR